MSANAILRKKLGLRFMPVYSEDAMLEPDDLSMKHCKSSTSINFKRLNLRVN